MGSEMCIRDSSEDLHALSLRPVEADEQEVQVARELVHHHHLFVCLLYTSDAADERSSVDLGGRRIIKKKKNITDCG